MKRLLIYVAINVLVVGLFQWWYQQPRRVVERKLGHLIEDLSIAPTTSRSSRLLKSSTIHSYFEDPLEISSPFDELNGSFTESDIDSGFAYLTESAREISIQREGDFETSLEGQHASVVFDATIKVVISRQERAVHQRCRVTTHWRKSKDGWLIHSSDWQEIP